MSTSCIGKPSQYVVSTTYLQHIPFVLRDWANPLSKGVFQAFYQQHLLSEHTPSQISWIGSLQAFLLIFCGIVTGPLYDKGYLRALLFLGSTCIVGGLMATSFAGAYWELMLAQGVAVGIGGGCLFVPSVAVLPMHFQKRKALAMGVAATGVSLGKSGVRLSCSSGLTTVMAGGIIFPAVFRRLQPQVGFGWATRTIAMMIFVILLVPVAAMRLRQVPSSARTVDLVAFEEASFMLYAIATFLAFVGLYLPHFHIQSYATEHLKIEPNVALYMVAVLNAGSFFGRIVSYHTIAG